MNQPQGLPGNTPSLTGVHGESLNGNSWRSNILSNTEGTTIPSGTITFNLNGSYNLSGFTFWNLGGGSIALTRQGIKNVTIEYSNNGGTTWSTLSGAPSMFENPRTFFLACSVSLWFSGCQFGKKNLTWCQQKSIAKSDGMNAQHIDNSQKPMLR